MSRPIETVSMWLAVAMSLGLCGRFVWLSCFCDDYNWGLVSLIGAAVFNAHADMIENRRMLRRVAGESQ